MLTCKPLCENNADCGAGAGQSSELACAAVTCSNGRNPGIRVCDRSDSVLAPSYGASSCCRGTGTGTPSAAGCADGTREAFTDRTKYPDIAGCAASWPLNSMRAPKTGQACGGALGCSVPADACGTGWHVCAAPPYGSGDIAAKVSADDCDAQPGSFAAAVGDVTCEPCSGATKAFSAACCGSNCGRAGGSCLFPMRTGWFPDSPAPEYRVNHCGAIAVPDSSAAGVLCCRGY
jgi:hypothetical protein